MFHLLKDNIYHAVIIQSQQFGSIALEDANLEKIQAVEDDKAFTLICLVVGAMDAAEFLAAELDRIAFVLAENVKSLFGNIRYQVAKMIHANDVSGNLLPSRLYLAVG